MQSFVEGELPADNEVLLDVMSKKAFEVESVELVKDADGKEDSLFEIKVLPNRVADAMSLEGMSRELASVFDFKMRDWRPKINLNDYKKDNSFVIAYPQNALLRFAGFKVNLNLNDGEKVETPEWIKDILVKSGGRSINCLVDITNLILFSIGQPAHVFDFEKLNGKIVTRFANEGEEIILLDGKKVTLKTSDFLITDEKQALSIAGIKGGKLAEVDSSTKIAFFELANFSSTMIRKTTQHINVRTDASKIFENGVSTEKTLEALQICIATVKEIYKNCEIEFYTDILIEENKNSGVEVALKNVNNYGHTSLTYDEVKKLLERQNFKVKNLNADMSVFNVLAPHERLDINVEEEVIEEVLRLYGFDNLQSKELNLVKKVSHDSRFLLENFIKTKMLNKGYVEVFNYTFVPTGNVKVKLGLAEDKMFLRNNLTDGAKKTFEKNYNFLPILQTNTLRFFETGSIFLDDNTEDKRCILVCDDNKKKSKYLPELETILLEVETKLGLEKIEIISKSEKPAMLEFSLDKIMHEIRNKKIDIPFVEVKKDLQSIKYKPLSIYPFISRDVAIWVPGDVDFVKDISENLVNLNLENCISMYEFDVFEKEGKKSIAFRLIFQSYEKTLTDAEVEAEMQKVLNYLKEKKFEIR